MLIYKIFLKNEWEVLQEKLETEGSPVDVKDSYIHFSTAETIKATVKKYYDKVENLFILGLESDKLEPLKWEAARGGTLFPHLYRKLKMDDILWSKPLPLVDGEHVFPEF